MIMVLSCSDAQEKAANETGDPAQLSSNDFSASKHLLSSPFATCVAKKIQNISSSDCDGCDGARRRQARCALSQYQVELSHVASTPESQRHHTDHSGSHGFRLRVEEPQVLKYMFALTLSTFGQGRGG